MVNVIEQTIEKALLGDKAKMDALVSSLRTNVFDEETFYTLLLALRRVMPSLTKEQDELVGVVLSADWSSYSEKCMQLFLEFVTDLVSTQSYVLKICVKSLIRCFLVKIELLGEDLQNFHIKCRYIHACMKSIVRMAPLAIKFIKDAVVLYFPYVGKGIFTLETYIVNILQMITYTQGCRSHILALIIDKLLSIDVTLPRVELQKSDEDNLQFDVDVMNINKSTFVQTTEKLDKLMTVLLTYAKDFCFSDGIFQRKQADSLVDDLLQIYEGVILKTQESSHVQFILFYVASFDKKFHQRFVEACWHVFETPNNAQIIRQASSSFMASFLVRANFISQEFLTQQIKQLSNWIHRYLKVQDGNSIVPDYRKHASFYSACQTLFYVFVYHHQYFVESKKGMQFVKSLELSRIVVSKLNPLKYCLKTVVDIFARITRMYEIVFCYSIIEHNNRCVMSQLFKHHDDEYEKHRCIETFFPFDPYMLSTSAEFIQPLYHHWREFQSEADDACRRKEINISDENDDDMDDIDKMFDNFEDHLGFKNSYKQSSSFDMMCISPGFSLPHR